MQDAPWVNGETRMRGYFESNDHNEAFCDGMSGERMAFGNRTWSSGTVAGKVYLNDRFLL